MSKPVNEAATRPPEARIGPLGLRMNDLGPALGVSRRTIERLRCSGKFPKPDRMIGKRIPLWTPETIRRWVEGGGLQ